jgi:hypothetical protein
VPAGWFRAGRVIELYEQSSRQIRLTQQLDRGSDFERCAFERMRSAARRTVSRRCSQAPGGIWVEQCRPAPLPIDTADARACAALIASLPLTNAREAHQTLVTLLTGLSHRPPSAAAYLEVLEATRAPLAFLQERAGAALCRQAPAADPGRGGGLPPGAGALAGHGARLCPGGATGAPTRKCRTSLALICQRCVHYAGKVILEFFRARREPSPGAWIDLHGYYATAEEWGIDKTAVPEPLNEVRKSQSAAEAYAAILLVDLASPYSRSAHEFAWIMPLGAGFASLTAVQPLGEPIETRAFGIDLMHDASARPLELLPQNRVGALVRHPQLSRNPEIAGPAQGGHESRRLGLGDDCPASAASRLLLQLYKPWCLNATPRRFQRRGASGIAQVCLGLEAIHFHVSGDEFNQPEHVRIYSRGDMERIWTFRDQPRPDQLSVRNAQVQLGYPLERWSVADQSVSGFRLQRGEAGARIEHGQLIGMKPPDGEHFLLAQVSWNLMLRTNCSSASMSCRACRRASPCGRPASTSPTPSAISGLSAAGHGRR